MTDSLCCCNAGAAWNRLDKDDNGNLCELEFLEVNKQLGLNWDRKTA